MTDQQVIAAVRRGMRPSEVAKAAKLPITLVHKIVYGWGVSPSRGLVAGACDLCGTQTERRGGPSTICDTCRPVHFKRASDASCAVRKAVRVGMLKPAKDLMCIDCGSAAEHYDHRDYSRPLSVEPVCRSCNIKRGVARQ